jgi:AcrR family transcriptional regulator
VTPRQPVNRAPAAPISANQQERYHRILEAAVALGSRTDFEHVQMQDVAVAADVAIATLYRYFPSKAHLFVGVMNARLAALDPAALRSEDGASRAERAFDLLASTTRQMVGQRRLSMSMIQSIILAHGPESADSDRIETRFLTVVLEVVGWGSAPSEDQRRRAWLVIQCWFGVLMTILSGDRPVAEAEADIRRACELLLGTD